jgi:hypothetical protein
LERLERRVISLVIFAKYVLTAHSKDEFGEVFDCRQKWPNKSSMLSMLLRPNIKMINLENLNLIDQ